jgi:hypothetical protein
MPLKIPGSDLRASKTAPSPDGRQYGGFIVRVYFDGQLQDARATPPELQALFRLQISWRRLPMRPPSVELAQH